MARGDGERGRGGRGRGRLADVVAAVGAALGCSTERDVRVDEPRQRARDDNRHLGTTVREAYHPLRREVSCIV